MKTIIAGSRSICDMAVLESAIASCNWEISRVVSGTADGVDKLGEQWAKGRLIPVEKFYPKWKLYGKYAGLVRNTEMARTSQALLAVWDGKSKGTAHMIHVAKKKGLLVYVHQVELAGEVP